MSFSPLEHCWFLTGPTASGKTRAGIELAGRIGAEIVSMDSMALYRGMDIGTAKPTEEERSAVPHHLIDVLEPHEECSVARYCEMAHAAVAEIRRRGRAALFVGGTPLYLKALLRGLFEGPPADEVFRERLRADAAQHAPGWLHERLRAVDPAQAERLHPNDQRRLIRALEVHHLTGRPISAWQQEFDRPGPESNRVYVIDWPRHELHRRIDERVERMFAAGLLDEVRRLLQLDRPLGKTARQAVGYREVIEFVSSQRAVGSRQSAGGSEQGGDNHPLPTDDCRLSTDHAELIELVQAHTRQLAKRQMTWFRGLAECRMVPMGSWLAGEGLFEQIGV